MELHEIIEAKWISGYSIQITFSNHRKGVVDLGKYLGKGVFKELTHIAKFKLFKVNAELGTICWPNGADVAPEVLYQEAFSKDGQNHLSDAA